MALDLNDKTANGNTLTNVGGTEVTSDLPFAQKSEAVDLESTESDYLHAADHASLDITGNLTVELWVKFESLPGSGNLMALVTKYNATGNQKSWVISLFNSTGTYQLYAEVSANGSTADAITQNWTPSTGTWYHVAFVYTASSSTYQFFVDGSQVGVDQNGTRTAIYNSTSRVEIGASGGGTLFFLDGIVTEVRIWNTARTGTEINTNKSIELTGSESGLAAYWPFETSLGESGSGYIFQSY
jgi:hypothetical protein